ncbi:hypothetical protein C9374_006111 [Naegleria lovaniensis]|uniref:PRA1 family protein n=1 Tax=Naegleria lovaniensis TaxID=51637 RepID=A0AA88GNY8_NAELO|nr:uncharacterized protein C9374_006111 [Naegleria lovaniensis]KAG2381727.1 hypothetical protein C9374_006111 [Naegleria lovaniensis]
MIAQGLFDVEPMLPPLRPMREFFAYTSLTHHTTPLSRRILDSLTFYQTNYLLINMIVLVICLMNSYLIFVVAPLVFSLFFFLAYHKSDFVAFGRIKVTKNLAIIACLASLLLIVLFAAKYSILFMGYVFTVIVVSTHSALTDRKRSQPTVNHATANRIFDPEEIIRRDEMQRSYQGIGSGYSQASNTYGGFSTSNRFNTAVPSSTINSYEPPSSTNSTIDEQQQQSMGDSRASREERKEKIKQQARQRIKENYGLE